MDVPEDMTKYAVLQKALLPTRLPVLPGVELSARYLLAETDASAGGDWFDSVVLDDARIALVVGDVVGHGVRASAVMGQLRAALGMALQDGADPAVAITRLEKFASRLPGAEAATVCVAVLDPSTGDLTYCAAGHPPPLIASRKGTARYVEPAVGSPLGAPGGYELGHDHLGLDDVLLLYTDGLIERPQSTPDQATADLLDAVEAAVAGPQYSAERVTEQVLDLVTGHSDDVTVLAAHRRTPVAAMTRTGPAVPETAARFRDEFAAWLRALEPEPVVVIGLESAVIELMANVVEHAYYDCAPGQLTLAADLAPSGQVAVSVQDHGRWKESEPSVDRGHGLALAGATVDDLTVKRTPDGTTATVRTALTKAPSMLVGEVSPATDRAEFSAAVADGRLLVGGPIDIVTARGFDRILREVARHATRPLTVDLSRVTHLASAGIRVLAAALRRSDRKLELVALRGTPADHVLGLTQLPHRTA
ncbi:SpoIIE family protein phosphatase [Kribbella sp. NPDC000426]|uniref:SpoIIE family protein phosphatase n=1 Tax=Kribbella sp. NPDC000426 TaxID=3154255 RepID=UPI00332A40CE